MWHPKNSKKKQEIALTKLYFNEQGYKNCCLISDEKQEKPDVIFKCGIEKIGIEITMLVDEWVMKDMVTKDKAKNNGSLNKYFTDSERASEAIQRIVNEKSQKSFINNIDGAKKVLLIYNNCPLAFIDAIKAMRCKIDKRGLDEVSIRIERDLINGPENDIWIDLGSRK